MTIDEVARLELNPGEVLVIRLGEPQPMEVLANAVRVLAESFPANKVLVLPPKANIAKVVGKITQANLFEDAS